MSYKNNIPSDWSEDIALLKRSIRHAGVFRFIVVQYNHFTVIEKIADFLQLDFPERPFLRLRTEKEDYFSLIDKLEHHKGFVLIEDFQFLTQSVALFVGFNQRRDHISSLPIQLLCFMPEGADQVQRCKENLRDFWSIRDLMLHFQDNPFIVVQEDVDSYALSPVYVSGGDVTQKRAELQRLMDRMTVLDQEASARQLKSILYPQIYQLYLDLGDYPSSLNWAEKWLYFTQTTAATPEGTAHALNALGYSFFSLGDYKTALVYYEEALAIREKTLSPEHPDLAQLYNNIAFTYGALGEHVKQLEYDQKSLTIREKVLPPEHPDLAQSYNNLAVTYGALGEHKKQLEYDQKALAIREKVLPPEHPELAQSYNNLALTYGALGEHKKQLEYDQKALAIREKILSPEHPNLAHSYNNLAITYRALGIYKKSLEYHEKALAIR